MNGVKYPHGRSMPANNMPVSGSCRQGSNDSNLVFPILIILSVWLVLCLNLVYVYSVVEFGVDREVERKLGKILPVVAILVGLGFLPFLAQFICFQLLMESGTVTRPWLINYINYNSNMNETRNVICREENIPGLLAWSPSRYYLSGYYNVANKPDFPFRYVSWSHSTPHTQK